MSANINDKLTATEDGGYPVPTTVSSSRSIGGSSLSCVALTDWPTDTAVHLITYKKKADGSMDRDTLCLWKGIVSGTTIGSLTLKGGTDAGNDSGDFVEMANTSNWAQGIYDWGTTEHKVDGTHDNTKVAMLAGTQTFTGDKTFTGTITVPNGSWGADTLATSVITGNNNPYKFRVYRNSSWTLGSSGTSIAFDTTDYDDNSDFSLTNHNYVVPVDGYYRFTAHVGFAQTTGVGYYGYIRVGSTNTIPLTAFISTSTNNSATYGNITGSDIIHCSQGDLISVWAVGGGNGGGTGFATSLSGVLVTKD